MGTDFSQNTSKVGRLQVDRLRAEDLKEEKVLTTPPVSIRPIHTGMIWIDLYSVCASDILFLCQQHERERSRRELR